MSLIDREKFKKEEERTESYYHNHPQYDQHHRQLDSLNCTSFCSDPRPDISTYVPNNYSFQNLISICFNDYENCPLDYKDISCWNTAGITDMSSAFLFESKFNAPLECWEVGKVTSMYRMFEYARKFNQAIDSWDVSQVENMNQMFYAAPKFNHPVDSWDVSQVKDMKRMFREAEKFNQIIDLWDVSQVENMYEMFEYAYNFNQPLDSWDVSQVKKMTFMFLDAKAFNQPIDSWDVSQVQYMNGMFGRAYDFNQCLSTWAEKTSDTVDTRVMFYTRNNKYDTGCPNGIESPNATIGPWCQDNTQGCFVPGFGTPTGAPTGTNNPNECDSVGESDFSFKGKSCKKYLEKKTGKKCKKNN